MGSEIYKVLVVEDDMNILMGLEDNLKDEGYDVATARNGSLGLEMGLSQNFHLVLLDIMLPGLNGFEVCKKLRQEKPGLPIIMLTARGSEIDKVAGLDYGADDYVTKPFSLTELLARIRALLRRAYPVNEEPEDYSFGNVHIDFKKMTTTVNGKEVKFTSKEYDILKYMIIHVGQVVSRNDLLENVWGYDYYPSTRTVDNFILDIRKKIEETPSDPRYITSVSGVGYRFDPS